MRIGSSPIISGAMASGRDRRRAGLRQRSVYERSARSSSSETITRPFFIYLNYTVPHAELRAPARIIAPVQRPLSREALRNPQPTRSRRARSPNVAIARLSLAADAACGVRGDDQPHGSRHRPARRCDPLAGHRAPDVADVRQRQRPASRRRRRSGLFFKSSGGLRGIKRDLYEGGIRVPMIARWPGTIPAGRVSDHVWAHWDVLPTLADIAERQSPPAASMESRWRVRFAAQTQPTHAFLYWEFHERGFQQAVRMGRWKARPTEERTRRWSCTTWKRIRMSSVTWRRCIVTWLQKSRRTFDRPERRRIAGPRSDRRTVRPRVQRATEFKGFRLRFSSADFHSGTAHHRHEPDRDRFLLCHTARRLCDDDDLLKGRCLPARP